MKKTRPRTPTPIRSKSQKDQGTKRIAVVTSERFSPSSSRDGKNQYHSQENYQLITETESLRSLPPTCPKKTGLREVSRPNSTYSRDQGLVQPSGDTHQSKSSLQFGDNDSTITRLPEGFTWSTFDLTEEFQMEELKEFLSKNYPEAEVEQLNYEYTTNYLKWKILPPSYNPNWHFGIREPKGKLVGVICGIPMKLFVEYVELPVAQVMFVCVNKNFRTIGLTPLLYSELSRRTYADSKISQLFFTSQKNYARDTDPAARTGIWAKDLDAVRKLTMNHRSSKSKPNVNQGMDHPDFVNGELMNELQKLTLEKAGEARRFLVNYLTEFRLQPIYSEKEFIHWFLSDPVETYVVVGKFGDITDLVSFYIEEVRVLKGSPIKKITCAHSLYTIATSMPVQNLMQDALKIAKRKGIDLFLTTNIMNNKEFIQGLNFQELGTLNYYLQGIKCSKILSSDIAFVSN